MTQDERERLVAVARGDRPADLLITNCRPVSVFTGEVMEGNCALAEGRVAGVGDYRDAHSVHDGGGGFLVPRFVDAHLHLESTLLSAREFVRAALPRGTGAVVIDPHEYANVWGQDGIRYVLEETEGQPIDFFVLCPSCVPASPFETSGAQLSADDLEGFLEHPRVLGLAEMMNYPGTVAGQPDPLTKLTRFEGTVRDGHAPGLEGRRLNAYLAAGATSDHETTRESEATEKLRRGMELYLRHGTSEQNLPELVPAVTPYSEPFCSLATDDRDPADLLREGHVDATLRQAVEQGLDPMRALRMATVNPARRFGLEDRGTLRPGHRADLCLLEDCTDFRVRTVFHRGRVVVEDGRRADVSLPAPPDPPETPMRAGEVHPDDFAVPARGSVVRLIELIPGQILTGSGRETIDTTDGSVPADPSRDRAKIAVLNRYRPGASPTMGFVKGFGLECGALATTFAHDSHNLVAVGIEDAALAGAVNRVRELGGGMVVADGEGRVRAELPLPVAGLTSTEPVEGVVERHDELGAACRELGCSLKAPFMQLSFLALAPVPKLKITDQSLVDADAFEPVELFVE